MASSTIRSFGANIHRLCPWTGFLLGILHHFLLPRLDHRNDELEGFLIEWHFPRVACFAQIPDLVACRVFASHGKAGEFRGYRLVATSAKNVFHDWRVAQVWSFDQWLRERESLCDGYMPRIAPISTDLNHVLATFHTDKASNRHWIVPRAV